MKIKIFIASLALLANLGEPLCSCTAAPGSLDLSFGGTGKIRTGFGGGYAIGNAAAVQSDGKLLLAGFGNANSPLAGGDFLIARLGTNNLLDPSFGDEGKVLTRVATNYASQAEASAIRCLRVQADGKILAAGFAYRNPNYSDFAIVRYNPDGSLDTTFGTNGMVFTDFGEQAQINGMSIQSDNQIVVAGSEANGGTSSGFALARYSTNGVLDPTFGSGGTVVTSAANSYTGANAMMIEGDGKFVAVGTGIASGDAGVDMAMFRYTTNGALDSAFGGGTGEVFTRISPSAYDYTDSAIAVATQGGTFVVGNPDKIVVAGTYEDDSVSPFQYYLAVMRYNLDGTLDSTFGSGGILITPISNWFSSAIGLAIQSTLFQARKIVVGGYVNDRTNIYGFMDRFNATGGWDTTFGPNGSGTVTFPLGQVADNVDTALNAMTVGPGQFVLAGYRSGSGGETDFAAERLSSNGLVDTNFGVGGLLLANVSDAPAQANAVTVQADGKVLAAGSANSGQYNPSQRFALARFNSDGTPDATFGSVGKVLTTISTNDQANALAIQRDGKIIAAGVSYSAFALARYNPDGTLDNTFGVNGKTMEVVGTGSGVVKCVQVQGDGKILAAGAANDSSGYSHFALARFNTNGAADTMFGSGGWVTTSFNAPPSIDNANGIAIQTNGKVVLGGYSEYVVGSSIAVDFAVGRYNTNGSLDFSFGSLGRATGNVGGGTLDLGNAMVLQPDGKAVVAGGAYLGGLTGNSFVALVRFNTNGTLDSTFGSGGKVVTEVGAYSDYATSLALQPDGKLIVAGASQNGLFKLFALRYNADGSVDNAFGNSGSTVLDFGSNTNEYAYALALDAYGRILLAGDAGGLFGVARLTGDIAVTPLLKIFLTSSNTVTVSWPYPSAGWNLQENTSLNAAGWTAPSETINNDGTNNFITANPAANSRFYRLYGP